MARDKSPIVKQSRREGYALHRKAHKVMARKSGIPGQHAGARQGKPSLYLTQLREKQKVRRIYGILERQFRIIVDESFKEKGQTGVKLLQLLERRLDNAVYRAGFAVSRRQARQLVTHGHFLFNGRRVDIPSIRLKPGDKVEVRPRSQQTEYFKHIDEVFRDAQTQPAGWLKADAKKMTFEVTGLPAREDAEPDIKDQLIVEFYSR